MSDEEKKELEPTLYDYCVEEEKIFDPESNVRFRFVDRQKNIANFLIKSNNDYFTKGQFFKGCIWGYLSENKNFMAFIEDFKEYLYKNELLSRNQRMKFSKNKRIHALREKEEKLRIKKEFGFFDDDELESLYKEIEEDIPEH